MKSTRFVLTPFYEILDTMVPLRRLRIDECTQANNSDRFAGRQIMEFSVQYHHSLLLSESKKQKVASFNIRSIIRFGKIEELETDEHGIVTRDSFPLHLQLDLNNTLISLPGLLPNDRHGKDGRRYPRPVDLSEGLIDNPIVSNHMVISWIQDECKNEYFYAMYLVRLRSCDELTSILLSQHMSAAATTLSLVYEQCSNLNGTVDDDLMLVNSTINTSLNCPVSRGRMEIPVRGQHCIHLQCFDCMTYLVMNFKKPTWRCPVCDKVTLFCFMEIDSLIFDILKDERSKTAGNIQFNKAGQWRPERKMPDSTETDHAYMDVLESVNQCRSLRDVETDVILTLKDQPTEQHKIDKYLKLVLSNSSHNMTRQFESPSPMTASPLTPSEPCSPQINAHLLRNGFVGFSPPTDMQDVHLAAMLRQMPQQDSRGTRQEPPPPQYHYEYLPQSSSVLMQRACPQAASADSSCTRLQITKVTSMARTSSKDVTRDIVVISDDEADDVGLLNKSMSCDIKSAHKRPTQMTSSVTTEVDHRKHMRVSNVPSAQCPARPQSASILTQTCTCSPDRTCPQHSDLASLGHQGMSRTPHHIPLASHGTQATLSAHSAQLPRSLHTPVFSHTNVPDHFRTGSSLQSVLAHSTLANAAAHVATPRASIVPAVYSHGSVHRPTLPPTSSYVHDMFPRTTARPLPDPGDLFSRFPLSNGLLAQPMDQHDRATDVSHQNNTHQIAENFLLPHQSSSKHSRAHLPSNSTVPSLLNHFIQSTAGTLGHSDVAMLSKERNRSLPNLSLQSSTDHRSLSNISAQSTLSNHSHSNISTQSTLSNHSLSNISIQSTLSNHSLSNISIQSTLSNHSLSNYRDTIGDTSRHNEVQRAVDSVMSPDNYMPASKMSLQSTVWNTAVSDSGTAHATRHANGSAAYSLSTVPNGHPYGHLYAHNHAPITAINGMNTAMSAQLATSNAASRTPFTQPTGVQHVGPRDPCLPYSFTDSKHSDLFLHAGLRQRIHSGTTSNSTVHHGQSGTLHPLAPPSNSCPTVIGSRSSIQQQATLTPPSFHNFANGTVPSHAAMQLRVADENLARAATIRSARRTRHARKSGDLNNVLHHGITNSVIGAMLPQRAAHHTARGGLPPQMALPGYTRVGPTMQFPVPHDTPAHPFVQNHAPHSTQGTHIHPTLRHDDDQDNIKPDLLPGYHSTSDFQRPFVQGSFSNIPSKQIYSNLDVTSPALRGRPQAPMYRVSAPGHSGVTTTMAPMSQSDIHAHWLHMMAKNNKAPDTLYTNLSMASRQLPTGQTLSSQEQINPNIFYGS